jgi:hypothetical protein
MGLRCSLFGHTFSETDTRRDREVRGDEVVTVVKTVERCGSCGAERVVSENKEVVSVVEADDVDEAEVAATETETGGTETEDSADTTADPEATGEDAAEMAAASEADEGTATGTDPDEPVEAPDLDPDADPDEEDVEFITETDGSLGGGDEVDVDPDEEAPEGGIGGMAARSGAYGDSEADDPVPDTGDEAADEDAEILGEDGERTDRAPGQWPDDPDATGEPWEPGELGGGPGTEPEPNEEVPEPAPVEPSPSPGKTPAADDEGDSLRCPGCGHTVPMAGSYRAGDACPECRSDYLEPASE